MDKQNRSFGHPDADPHLVHTLTKNTFSLLLQDRGIFVLCTAHSLTVGYVCSLVCSSNVIRSKIP